MQEKDENSPNPSRSAPLPRERQKVADIDLADMLGERYWRPDELGAILRHQLSAPIRFDMRALGGVGRQIESLAEARGLVLKSFADLLNHPNPPLELLDMTRQFARRHLGGAESIIPREVAIVLYYASIVAARLRCGAHISKLEDGELLRGVTATLAHPWLDERTRTLLEQGLALIRRSSGVTP